jgi:hypothetical protein
MEAKRQNGIMGLLFPGPEAVTMEDLKEIQRDMDAGRFGSAAHRLDIVIYKLENNLNKEGEPQCLPNQISGT